jgi:hypothetical protein
MDGIQDNAFDKDDDYFQMVERLIESLNLTHEELYQQKIAYKQGYDSSGGENTYNNGSFNFHLYNWGQYKRSLNE